MVIRIPLPKDLPHNNQRWHWAKRAAVVADMKNTTALLAKSARNEAGASPTQLHRNVTLTICRAKGQRLLDADNATTAMKPVLDGLKMAGVIYDDSPKYLTATYEQQKRPDWRGVIVTVDD